MEALPDQIIIDFLEKIQATSPEQYQIALKVRELYLTYGPDLTEGIKYGGLVYFREGDLLGGIFFYKKHISLEFSYGVSLSDPFSVLEGKGNLRRHIKLTSVDDTDTKNVAHYIKEALTV